ncbi:hypothetical protein [Hyalangium sp.]|uniref:hypothetical protein n=1 Tax=Hyalangium sp. TaxID=2028555 RepID=UPI0038997FA8
MKWAVAVVAASSLVGCFNNSQPSIYRVAVTPTVAPSSCYKTAPTGTPDTTTNLVDEKQWVIWEGIDDKFYLEPGTINYQMGEAQRINITTDAIEGGKQDKQYVFTTVRTQTAGTNEVYTTSATYTFDELGKTLQGTLTLHSSCAGSNCSTTSQTTCDISTTFSGRQISGDQNIQFGSNGGG